MHDVLIVFLPSHHDLVGIIGACLQIRFSGSKKKKSQNHNMVNDIIPRSEAAK